MTKAVGLKRELGLGLLTFYGLGNILGADIMNDPEGVMVPDETGFQLLAANLAMAEVHDVRTATSALKFICRLRTDLQVSLGTKLMGISAKSGWMISDPLAHQFIDEFQEFLPLAYEELNS